MRMKVSVQGCMKFGMLPMDSLLPVDQSQGHNVQTVDSMRNLASSSFTVCTVATKDCGLARGS